MQKLTFSISTDEIIELQVYTSANDFLALLKEASDVLGNISAEDIVERPYDILDVTYDLYSKIQTTLEHAGQA